MTAKPESKPTMGEMLEAVFRSHAESTRGAMPATVVAYSFATGRVDVQPATQVYVEGELQELPVLTGVPVLFPGGLLGSLVIPLSPGDGVWIAPGEVDMSAYLATGTPALPPATKRRFSLADCVAIPGLRSLSAPLPVGSADASATVIRSADLRLGSALAVDPVSLQSKVATALAAVKAWSLLVEAFCNGIVPGTFNPGTTLFAPDGVAPLTGALKVKGE